eukprot:5914268-Prymnesium_polylepis.1
MSRACDRGPARAIECRVHGLAGSRGPRRRTARDGTRARAGRLQARRCAVRVCALARAHKIFHCSARG